MGFRAEGRIDAIQPSVTELDDIAQIIRHAAHLLPAQGPITVFIHHNTLHAFEHLPFHEAVRAGARTFGCEPYLSEQQYHRLLASERFTVEDLEASLLDDLGDAADVLVGRMGTRFFLRLAMLQRPLQTARQNELKWHLVETDALRRFHPETPAAVKRRVIDETRRWVMRDLRHGQADAEPRVQQSLRNLFDEFDVKSIERWDEWTWESFCLHWLWLICRHGAHGISPSASRPALPVRHRDLLLQITGSDTDLLVNEPLIRLSAAFLDQGIAHWPLPHRSEGFFAAFVRYYAASAPLLERWLRGLRREVRGLASRGMSALESIAQSLTQLGIFEEGERREYLEATMLSLRGWAGMFWQLESRGDRVVHQIPTGSLIDYVAVRMILERHAITYILREQTSIAGPLSEVRGELLRLLPRVQPPSESQRAHLLFQLAQVLAWKPSDLFRLAKLEWQVLIHEIERFSGVDRRRVFHQALERRHRIQTLDAISAHQQSAPASCAKRSSEPCTDCRPSFQVVCCIDERSESFRRHLEEVAPDCQTFGVAGFFGVAMYYRGALDAHYVPLCPVVIRPQHFVREQVAVDFIADHQRRLNIRRWIGSTRHQLHMGSRTFTVGAVLSALLGPPALVLLVVRTLFPRLASRLRSFVGGFLRAPPRTELLLERSEAMTGDKEGHLGYTVDEMADIVQRTLQDIGLVSHFAPLVLIVGHGSTSLNNPHESAHDCGACGGGRGGPNARAFVQMANGRHVRARLAERGLTLADGIVFVAAYHNTCNDAVEYFDLDRVPDSHAMRLQQAQIALEETRRRDAHERCRRFESASLSLSPEAALKHVEARAEDFSQVRPEYGHATNAICVVGRRLRTQHLFLDRRAFLVSYDPTQDDSQSDILARVLAAVFPVCGGINLEYYFSYTDPPGWGCGTKLPHNITGLLGVMDGAASDLRTGLPWQMTEIHEPVRLLCIIETTPATMMSLWQRDPTIAAMCRNEWVQLALLDPHSAAIHFFCQGRFEPYHPTSTQLPSVPSSADWYRGSRDHLGYAEIATASSAVASG